MQNNIQQQQPPPPGFLFLPFVYYASRASLTTLDSLRFFFPSLAHHAVWPLLGPQEKVGTMVHGLARVKGVFYVRRTTYDKVQAHGVRYTMKGRSQTSSHLMSKQPW
jgi:hypothetical protein